MLDVLLTAEGSYMYGEQFVQGVYLTQSHRAIRKLERRFGWTIERSPDRNEHGFMGHAIKPTKAEQLTLPTAQASIRVTGAPS